MIETRLLHYFLAVAREQNITKAAEALHISQPTLSKQLQELERQVGKPLLVRGRKNVTLTEDGVYLRARAGEILLLLQQTETALSESEDTLSGDVRIGCAETPALSRVAELLRDMHEEFPRTRFHIFTADGAAIMERLDSGTLDLALFSGPVPQENYDHWPLPISAHWGLLMRQDDPLAGRDNICIEELYRIPLIFPTRIYDSPWAPADFTIDRSALRVAATYNAMGAAIHLVRHGMGCGFCLSEHVLPTDDLTFRPITPKITVHLSLVTKKNAHLSPAAKMLLKRLQEALA